MGCHSVTARRGVAALVVLVAVSMPGTAHAGPGEIGHHQAIPGGVDSLALDGDTLVIGQAPDYIDPWFLEYYWGGVWIYERDPGSGEWRFAGSGDWSEIGLGVPSVDVRGSRVVAGYYGQIWGDGGVTVTDRDPGTGEWRVTDDVSSFPDGHLGMAVALGDDEFAATDCELETVEIFRPDGPGSWASEQSLAMPDLVCAWYATTLGLDGEWLAVDTLAGVRIHRRQADGTYEESQVLGERGDVAIEGSILAVGASLYELGTAGVWRWVQTLDLGADRMADAVALSGDRVVVSSDGDSGRVIDVFDRGGDGVWTRTQRLTDPEPPERRAEFARSVAVDGWRIVGGSVYATIGGPADAHVYGYIDRCAGRYVTVPGTTGDDVLRGTPAIDVIRGYEGDDILLGLGGDDVICGGPGDDLLKGHLGDDLLQGGEEDDRLVGGPGDDVLLGHGGNDKIWGQGGEDLSDGGPGRDQLRGGTEDDELSGGDDADRIWGQPGNDVLAGDSGSDFLFGDIGDDVISGGPGNDRVFGGDGADELRGEEGRDQLRGQQGDDLIDGGPQRDWCSVEIAQPVNCEASV